MRPGFIGLTVSAFRSTSLNLFPNLFPRFRQATDSASERCSRGVRLFDVVPPGARSVPGPAGLRQRATGHHYGLGLFVLGDAPNRSRDLFGRARI
jgi:hypothetical protein